MTPEGDTDQGDQVLTKDERKRLADLRVTQRRWVSELPSQAIGPKLVRREEPRQRSDLIELRMRVRGEAERSKLDPLVKTYINAMGAAGGASVAQALVRSHEVSPLASWSRTDTEVPSPMNVQSRLERELEAERRQAEVVLHKASESELASVAAAVRRPVLWLLAAEAGSLAPDEAVLKLLVER